MITMKRDFQLCACGCGAKVSLNKIWIHGHHQKGKNNNFYGKKHSKEMCEHLSEKAKEDYKNGTRKVWCEGLTKEDNGSLKRQSINLSNTRKKLIKEGKLKAMGHGMDVIIMFGKDNPFYGKKHTDQTRAKMVQNHADVNGNNNPNWLGGISFEPYDSRFNKRFKKEIRKRDNYTCLKCHRHESKEKLERGRRLSVHHIDYNKENTTEENCCTICTGCNTEVNYDRNHWTKFFKSLLKEKYGYNYKIKEYYDD